MKNVKIRVSEILELIKREREIESYSLNEIDFVDDFGNSIEISKEVKEEFLYTGLGVTDFITTGFYKTGFEKEDATDSSLKAFKETLKNIDEEKLENLVEKIDKLGNTDELTNRQIDEWNKLIVDFLWDDKSLEDDSYENYITNKHKYDDLCYHQSFDWLIPVVEKIESLENYYVEIVKKSCYIYDIYKFDDKHQDAFIIEDGKTKLEAVYKAVVKFIK